MARRSSGWRSGLVAAGVVGALTVGSAVVTVPLALAAPSTDAAVPVVHDRVVSEVPVSWTPQVKDGRVLSIAQVGGSMVVAGTFTQVSAANGSGQVGRQGVFAFSASNGAITAGFNPTVDGAINAVFPGPTADTVYIAGTFKTVNSVPANKVALLNVDTGAMVTTFTTPRINGAVQDVVKLGNRLFLGGAFTTVAGVAHQGLATVNASTGAVDPYMGVDVSVNHNWVEGSTGARGAVGVKALAIAPDGKRLVAIGNFKDVDGLVRDQVVLIDLGASSAQVASWRTRRYEPECFSGAFDSYVRDVDFSPDGSYFVIVATGGPNPGTLCDAVARWSTNAAGDAVEPVWIGDTGGDTLQSVADTGVAVYVGGHQRWLNNTGGRDSAVQGAVPRPGLGAVDIRSGVVTTWNPGRHPRGIGAEALQPTAAGLWVGSDTNYIGNREYWRPRLAFFPLASGVVPAAGSTTQLPANVYLGSPGTIGTNALSRRFYDGSVASATSAAPSGGLDWSKVRAATTIDGDLWYGLTDGTFHRRTFDGTNYGPDLLVDPYNDAKWSEVQTGSGQTYRGVVPGFYGEISTTTGLAFQDGQLYSTRGGVLYARAFTPDSGVVSGVQRTVATISGIGGIFFSGGDLWFSNTLTGNLAKVAFVNGAPSGSPMIVSGPLLDGVDWRAKTLFTGPGPDGSGPVNTPPTARFVETCQGLSCSFDGSTSSDPDGTIASYLWSFGDGSATAPGAQSSHSYAKNGTYQVTLTVTDSGGATASTTRSVTVSNGVSLTTVGSKVKGVPRVELKWQGISTPTATIYKNNAVLATVSNVGSYVDTFTSKGGGTFVYRVCDTGTTRCSNDATVVF